MVPFSRCNSSHCTCGATGCPSACVHSTPDSYQRIDLYESRDVPDKPLKSYEQFLSNKINEKGRRVK